MSWFFRDDRTPEEKEPDNKIQEINNKIENDSRKKALEEIDRISRHFEAKRKLDDQLYEMNREREKAKHYHSKSYVYIVFKDGTSGDIKCNLEQFQSQAENICEVSKKSNNENFLIFNNCVVRKDCVKLMQFVHVDNFSTCYEDHEVKSEKVD